MHVGDASGPHEVERHRPQRNANKISMFRIPAWPLSTVAKVVPHVLAQSRRIGIRSQASRYPIDRASLCADLPAKVTPHLRIGRVGGPWDAGGIDAELQGVAQRLLPVLDAKLLSGVGSVGVGRPLVEDVAGPVVPAVLGLDQVKLVDLALERRRTWAATAASVVAGSSSRAARLFRT